MTRNKKEYAKKYYKNHKKQIKDTSIEWLKNHPGYKTAWRHKHGINKPMEESKHSGSYLGIVIAEKALSKFFDNITRMPPNNRGFDFLCGKGYKIDVKSSCIRLIKNKYSAWEFDIRQNKIADYFLLLAFNDRTNLTPMHVWLINGNKINTKHTIQITNSKRSLMNKKQFEQPIDKVINCCNKMR